MKSSVTFENSVERVSYGHLTDRNLNDIGFFAGISLICKTESDLNRKIRQLSELIPDIDKFYLIMKENDEKKTPLDSEEKSGEIAGKGCNL